MRRLSRSRVPAILQTNLVGCGPVCLAMVLGHHGQRVSPGRAAELCPAGRNGVSAGAIARAARGRGLEVTAHRTGPGVIRQIPLPAIAHWGEDHFVVVERLTRTGVRVVDPKVGRRTMPLAEFERALGLVVLALRPGPAFATTTTAERPFWRTYLAGLLRLPGTRALLTQVLLATVALQALGLAVPFVTRSVVDRPGALGGPTVNALLAAGVVLVVLAQLATGGLRSSLLIYLQGRLDSQAMLGFVAHLLRLPIRFFERRSTGDITLRIWTIAMLRETLTSQTLASLLDATLVLSYLGILLYLDVTIGLAVLAVVVVGIAILIATTGAVRDRMAADLATQGEMQGHIVEALEGITTVKAGAAEERVLDRYSALFVAWMRATLRRGYLSATVDAAASGLRVLTPLLVLWIGIGQVTAGELAPGTMLAVTWLSASIVTPLSTLMANGQRLQLAGAAMQRLADVLTAEPEYPEAPPSGTRVLLGGIELDGVGFGYEEHEPRVLDCVSLTVRSGQRVAIVGRTGAGKTTLGMLLLGLYAPTSGEIRFDGVPLRELDPRQLRAQLGVVLQEPFVFAGTIAENISMRDPAVGMERIRRCAELAGLHDEIAAMPRGYDTRLAERGVGLSGGQRQRLALARALVREPAILLLDEATSHLDAATEAVVSANLDAVPCTQVVIAHRLSTVRDADLIVVLDGGRVVDAGRHRELLGRCGHYARLVAAQLDTPDGYPGTSQGEGGDHNAGNHVRAGQRRGA